MSNATDLFIKPDRAYHNSESFWTSLFALYILGVSNSGAERIPAYQHTNRGEFRKDGFLKIPSGLKFEDVVVEGGIGDISFFKKAGFNGNEILEDFWFKPDVVIRADSKKVIVIEIKTVGHHLGEHQKNNYVNFTKFLNERGCNAELYFLLSCGHEKNSDWELLTEKGEQLEYKILLWEDVLKGIDVHTIELKKCFSGIKLLEYTDI